MPETPDRYDGDSSVKLAPDKSNGSAVAGALESKTSGAITNVDEELDIDSRRLKHGTLPETIGNAAAAHMYKNCKVLLDPVVVPAMVDISVDSNGAAKYMSEALKASPVLTDVVAEVIGTELGGTLLTGPFSDRLPSAD